MVTELLPELIKVPEFKSVPHNQLQWLAGRGEVRTYNEGDRIFKPGDDIDGMSIVLEGGLQLYALQGGNRRDLGMYERLEILGRLPYSRMKAAAGEGFAVGNLQVFFLHRDHFHDMICECHEITEALVHNMTDRVRDFTKFQQQNDKMMALGKLSAGLAHELNNPSAAVVRSAQELKKNLSAVPENFKRVLKIKATDEVVDKVNSLLFTKIDSIGKVQLSLMQKTTLEDELTEWLENEAFPDAYEVVETFASFGFAPGDLDQLRSWLRAEDVQPVVRWLHQMLTTERLVTDIEEASKRINALVTSVKGYTHMDQAPEKHKVDIHIGIRNTFTMLQHKLRKAGVKLVENFAANPPEANILVSEMNQVWTNLIDNALDAMEDRPNSILEVKTETDREFTVVSVIDNGPGIPKDIQDKIFDVFFTTKAIGKGTGLGLDVVRRIVDQHNGKIEMASEPGCTVFKVCFPTNKK
jgi:signal transduction histidine kinase